MQFEFATAARILFGPGKVREIAPMARQSGRRVMVITGRSRSRSALLEAQLLAQQMECSFFTVSGEPTTDLVISGVRQAREFGAEVVIGFGGGSVIDAGKAIAGLATNAGDLFDYLEVIGGGRSLEHPGLPYIAAATTSGPGTEVTRNAVLASPAHRVKVSLRSPFLLPKVAVVDPELALEMPPEITAATGLDALTQLIEPYLSVRANHMTDLVCLAGIGRVANSQRQAFYHGSELAARTDMALASLFGGLALANAGLGAVHGFAGPIGGMFPAPHGAVCAALLPSAMEVNLRALQQRGDSAKLQRFGDIAKALLKRDNATPGEGIQWLRTLIQELRIPMLGHYGISKGDVPLLCEKATVASSMKGNPISLQPNELQEILEKAL